MLATKRPTIHDNPQPLSSPNVPRDVALHNFAQRLQSAMNNKGWNQSELARQATLHAGDSEVTRDNVSKYLNGKAMPGPVKLNAIALALGVEKSELVPTRGITYSAEKTTRLSIEDVGDGGMWVRLNQWLPQAAAMKILAILSEYADEEAKRGNTAE